VRGAAPGAAIGERRGTALVVGVHPLPYRLRVAVRVRRHARGTAGLRDLIERQKALAGARMERAGRQPPQVLRRLTPARAVNMQHNRSEHDTVIYTL
jgi:hypothetical protein